VWAGGVRRSPCRHNGLVLVVAGLVDAVVAVLVTIKVAAYVWELGWMVRGGAVRLRREYMWRYRRKELPTREDERNAGRPLVITFVGHTLPGRILGLALTAPGIIVLSALLSLSVAASTPRWLALWIAFSVASLLILMCATSLIARALLGPLDRLNPDVGVGGFENGTDGLLYPSSDPAQENPYGRYLFVLLACLTIGFTTVYANASEAVAHAFTGGASADPIRWLYFTSTFAATFSASDLAPGNNVGRVLVCAQLGCAVVVAGTLIASLMPAKMPERDDPMWAGVDGETPPSTRLR
jgi:hypothetical protein